MIHILKAINQVDQQRQSSEARAIEQDMNALKSSSTSFLRDEYKRMHRVCNTSELTKGDLVWGILLAMHGQKRMDEYYATKKGRVISIPRSYGYLPE